LTAIPALLLLLCALAPLPAGAQQAGIPIPTLSPSKTRSEILRSAEKLVGTPYLYGGKNSEGLDCSGLVHLVLSDITGQPVPRTVAEQRSWALPIPRKEARPGDLVFFSEESLPGLSLAAASGKPSQELLTAITHVGIYLGDDSFIHAASTGARKGVIISSLGEASWARRLVFVGRAVSASALSGLALDVFAGAVLDAAEFNQGSFRGAGIWAMGGIPLWTNFQVGIQAGLRWDSLMHTVRLPLELSLGQVSGFSLSAGPALTIGTPRLDTVQPERLYEAVPALVAGAGLRWSPLIFRSGASGAGLFAELRVDRYLPIISQGEDLAADRRATISLSLGLRYRQIHY